MFFKLKKLLKLISHKKSFFGIFNGIYAAVEHLEIISKINPKTVFDVGANKGQFALAANIVDDNIKIISFEPQIKPAKVFKNFFKDNSNVALHECAIDKDVGTEKLHISGKNDSSSLLQISDLQEEIFKGTKEIGQIDIEVRNVDSFQFQWDQFETPKLLKIDVQGSEMRVLKSFDKKLKEFDYIYAELSFCELYLGQPLAHEIIRWLDERSFNLIAIHNLQFNSDGISIQADYLFKFKVNNSDN